MSSFAFVKRKMLILFCLCISALKVSSIWPPGYKVDLKYEEEFVISELLDRDDVQDIYDEEEMIRKEDLERLKINNEIIQSQKYHWLHKQARRKNVAKQDDNRRAKVPNLGSRYTEFNPEEEDAKPWIGGIVDKNKYFIKNVGKMQLQDLDMFYIDDDARLNKSSYENLEKRSPNNSTLDTDYNYENLKAEYSKEVKKAEIQGDTLKHKEIKEEELPKEAIKTLIDFEPRNCTEEEKSGLGLATVKCFWMEARHKELNKDKKSFMIKKILMITIIWMLVYLVIALPLWCQYGWCCCCCRCKFCRPRDQIEDVKSFFVNNPPGTYHDEKGELVTYKPTTYEIYAQKKLDKAIQRL